jgi:hypothetical protein
MHRFDRHADRCNEQVLRNRHINIFDLIEARCYRRAAKAWANWRELARYSQEIGRVSPLAEEQQGTPL